MSFFWSNLISHSFPDNLTQPSISLTLLSQKISCTSFCQLRSVGFQTANLAGSPHLISMFRMKFKIMKFSFVALIFTNHPGFVISYFFCALQEWDLNLWIFDQFAGVEIFRDFDSKPLTKLCHFEINIWNDLSYVVKISFVIGVIEILVE